MATKANPSTPRQRQLQLIGRALAHVETHLGEALDARVLADRAALSRHHFHRVFQAHVGVSVAEYVTWRRLQRACALLASGTEPVADIAWAVGYESAQALAKAMRRELDATPTAVRRGQATVWTRLLQPAQGPLSPDNHQEEAPMQPDRITALPDSLFALTATARGMVGHSLKRAAQQAFGELMPALGRAGLAGQVRSHIALVIDDPQGPDDPNCRYTAGVVFGYELYTLSGSCTQPAIELSGSLAWMPIPAGAYAVFTHIGPYTLLHRAWASIYRDWLPASGRRLRDVPALELCLNSPSDTPPEKLHTEIWIPIE
jgi:AraC family transcriptional regulator